MQTIEQCAEGLAAGTMTSRALVEACLARIAEPDGEGSRAFIKVHAEQARAMPMRWMRCAVWAARQAAMPASRSA